MKDQADFLNRVSARARGSRIKQYAWNLTIVLLSGMAGMFCFALMSAPQVEAAEVLRTPGGGTPNLKLKKPEPPPSSRFIQPGQAPTKRGMSGELEQKSPGMLERPVPGKNKLRKLETPLRKPGIRKKQMPSGTLRPSRPGGHVGVVIQGNSLKLKPGYKFEEISPGQWRVRTMQPGGANIGGTWECSCNDEPNPETGKKGGCGSRTIGGILHCTAGTCSSECACDMDVTTDPDEAHPGFMR